MSKQTKRLELDLIYHFGLNGDQIKRFRQAERYEQILRQVEIGSWDGAEMLLQVAGVLPR